LAKDLLELMDGLAIPLEDDDVAHFSGVYRGPQYPPGSATRDP
jgi:hypothetical protein